MATYTHKQHPLGQLSNNSAPDLNTGIDSCQERRVGEFFVTKQEWNQLGRHRQISQSDSNIDSLVLHEQNPKTKSNYYPDFSYQRPFSTFENSLETSNSKGSGPNGDNWNVHSKFPSPPLSPKIDPSQRHLPQDGLEDFSNVHQKDSIIIEPSWKRGQIIKNYRRNLRTFLLSYRLFSNQFLSSTENDNYYSIKRQSRYLRNLYKDEGGSSGFNNEGLRRQLLKNQYRRELNSTLNNSRNNNYYDYHARRSASPTTRNHQFHQRIGTSSSPPPTIASIDLISEVPQYIPNISWQKLPDYSPSLETLPAGNNKCMKVEWKGSPLNLSNDPLISELHPAELYLASILRLPCDLYLDSKRRLFLEKVCKFKKGLPFRRTDAQKACRIDVNKASRLFSAFEKVGWLKDGNFIKYLK